MGFFIEKRAFSWVACVLLCRSRLDLLDLHAPVQKLERVCLDAFFHQEISNAEALLSSWRFQTVPHTDRHSAPCYRYMSSHTSKQINHKLDALGKISMLAWAHAYVHIHKSTYMFISRYFLTMIDATLHVKPAQIMSAQHHKYIHIYVHIYIYICIYVYMYTCVWVYVCMYMYMYIIYIIYIYIHTYIRIYIHIPDTIRRSLMHIRQPGRALRTHAQNFSLKRNWKSHKKK